MLHMRLMVNGNQIGRLEVQRLPPDQPTDDDICTYRWLIHVNGETRTSGDQPLAHRYGDGAWALVAKVIDAAGLVPVVGESGSNEGDRDV